MPIDIEPGQWLYAPIDIDIRTIDPITKIYIDFEENQDLDIVMDIAGDQLSRVNIDIGYNWYCLLKIIDIGPEISALLMSDSKWYKPHLMMVS